MITDRERIEFLCMKNRFTMHADKVVPFVWCWESGDIYATGDDWEEALDHAIRRYRSEHRS